MDKVFFIENILETLIFVGSAIIGAILYGILDKKYSLTDKIFDPFNIDYKREWILHLLLSVVSIVIINYLGVYVFRVSWFVVVGVSGIIAGICVYNSNRRYL